MSNHALIINFVLQSWTMNEGTAAKGMTLRG
jgi:hypothetical protein